MESTSCTLQDCNQFRPSIIKTTSGNVAPRRPNSPTRRPRAEIPSNSVFGFSVSENQFQSLQRSEPAESQSKVQGEDRLIDPRSTRFSRLQATRRTEDQETLGNEGIFHAVPLFIDEQGIVTSGDCVEPVSSRLQPTFFPYSLSISRTDVLNLQSVGNVHYELEIGVDDDALYISNVNDVACTNKICNKRISTAGQEWSVGRPGNRPIGARDAARNPQTCLGPYATHKTI